MRRTGLQARIGQKFKSNNNIYTIILYQGALPIVNIEKLMKEDLTQFDCFERSNTGEFTNYRTSENQEYHVHFRSVK